MKKLRWASGFVLLFCVLGSWLATSAFRRSGGFSASATPVTFVSGDGAGTATLLVTPSGGFTGKVNISFQRPTYTPPAPWLALPSSVSVTASSPTISSAKQVAVAVSYKWTGSLAVGDYEITAVLTSGSLTYRVILYAYVKANRIYVTTYHNDPIRTGRNPLETSLTTSNINNNSFGSAFQHLTNGGIEAQILYVPSVYANGAFHNVVYAASVNGFVYAFDADNATGPNANPLWTADVGPVAPAGFGGGGDSYNQGEISTPVIDTELNTIFVVTKNMVSGNGFFELHALDLGTGRENFHGPKTISATISGTLGGVNGQVNLQSAQQYQRVGLLLLNGVVYIGIGGLDGDPGPCRGWVLGYNASTLQQTCAYTSCPDVGSGSQTAFAGGGIWMSGAGLASDGTYIYAATGNGDFDANNAGGKDYGDSVIKLQPSGSNLILKDYFTPNTQQTLAQKDLDLGCSGPMILPGDAASTPLILQLSKTSEVYLLNRGNLGKFNASLDQCFQEFSSNATAFHCNPAYYNKVVYFASDGGPLTAYSVSNSGINTTPINSSGEAYDQATPSISYNDLLANPASSAIVWIEQNTGDSTLIAYRASDLTELFSSDTGGPYMKNSVPTIANGKVYVGCEDRIVAYGLKG